MTFLRAPDSEDPEVVIEWLLARGCTDIRLYCGPDKRIRGSGLVVDDGDGEAVTA